MTARLLPVTAPFDLRLTLAFLNRFPPAQGEQEKDGELWKATRLSGQTVGFVVQQEGLCCLNWHRGRRRAGVV